MRVYGGKSKRRYILYQLFLSFFISSPLLKYKKMSFFFFLIFPLYFTLFKQKKYIYVYL